MPTGPEPTTAPPPVYNPDPAVTGYVPPAPTVAVNDATPTDHPGEFYFTIVAEGIARRLMAVSFALWHYAASVSIPDPANPNKSLGYTDPEFNGFTYPPQVTPPPPAAPPAPWFDIPTPFVAHARQTAACWIMTFKYPGDPLPQHRQAIQNGQAYKLTVDKTLTDGGGVTWLRVWPNPELWVLADQAQP